MTSGSSQGESGAAGDRVAEAAAAGASNAQAGREQSSYEGGAAGYATVPSAAGQASEQVGAAGAAGSLSTNVAGQESVSGGSGGSSAAGAAGRDNIDPTGGSAAGGATGSQSGGAAGAHAASAGAAGVDSDSDSGVLIESVPRPLGCSADGWCWSNPSPIGSDLHAIWVTSEDDVWVAGERGAIVHFDGQEWTQAAQTTTYEFLGLWASGPDDVWAVGSLSAIVHFDGKTWRDYSVPEIVALFTVWGSGPNDVWAAGLSGALYHFDGKSWTPWNLGTDADFRSLWGSAQDDVWLGTEQGFLHYDGKSWSAVPSPTGQGGWSTWGASYNDIWSADSDAVLHYDGKEWKDMAVPINEIQSVGGMWIDADGAAWTTASFPGQETVLFRYAAGQWQEISLGMDDLPVGKLMGSASGPLWIVGIRGTRVRYDGQSFEQLTTDVNPELGCENMLALAPDDVWASSEHLYHNTGSGWEVQPLRDVFAAPGFLWAPSSSEIWNFETNGAVDRFDRTTSTWTTDLREIDSTISFPQGVWGTVDDLYVAASYSARRVDGTWDRLLGGAGYMDVYGMAADDIWFVGDDRCWAHWNGSSWDRLCTGGADDIQYRSVWGAASDDFWFVGNRGVIYHYDGSSWTPSDSGTYTYLNEIWGSGAQDVWVAGDEGLILHWEGAAWSPSESGTDRALTYVTGSSANDVWACGAQGAILHRTQSYRH